MESRVKEVLNKKVSGKYNCAQAVACTYADIAHLDEETVNCLIEETPLSRIGTPADIADAVSFLASENADFITGQILGVNGGMVI